MPYRDLLDQWKDWLYDRLKPIAKKRV